MVCRVVLANIVVTYKLMSFLTFTIGFVGWGTLLLNIDDLMGGAWQGLFEDVGEGPKED